MVCQSRYEMASITDKPDSPSRPTPPPDATVPAARRAAGTTYALMARGDADQMPPKTLPSAMMTMSAMTGTTTATTPMSL